MEKANAKLGKNKKTTSFYIWRQIFRICKFIKIIKSTLKIKYEISSTKLYCQSKIIKKIYTPVLTSSPFYAFCFFLYFIVHAPFVSFSPVRTLDDRETRGRKRSLSLSARSPESNISLPFMSVSASRSPKIALLELVHT